MGPIWAGERGVGVFTGSAPSAPVVSLMKGTGGPSFYSRPLVCAPEPSEDFLIPESRFLIPDSSEEALLLFAAIGLRS
jgi:hypothetical protein